MTFLTPIPAIVAASVCLPLLIVVYLLKLRRRPIRVSSTLLWTQSVRDVEVNVPFRWLRPTWLFVLQLLALACLLLAFARPVLNGGEGDASRVLILIDRSASMSAMDGVVDGKPTTRLREAKSRAIRLIDDLSRAGAPSIGVIEFADQARTLTPLSQNMGDARAAIESVRASDQPGDLAAALRLASTLLAPSAENADEQRRNEPGIAHILTDGGSRGDSPLVLRGGVARYERVGALEADHDNLGIVAIAARRDFDDPGTVRVFARVLNAGTTARRASLALLLDGVELERRAIEVPAEGGQTSVTFAMQTRSAGIVTARLDRADLLASDNQASLVLRSAARPRVMLVMPDERPGGTTPRAEWVLSAALSEMGVPLRVIRASAYERDVSSGETSPADLVVFDRVRPRRTPACATLSIGAGLPVPGLDARASATGSTPRTVGVLSWSRNHPLLRNVGLDSVVIASTLRLVDPGGADAVRTSELARGSDGPLIVLGEEQGIRRLVVLFDLAESNWPVQVGFPLFLASAIDYLTLRGQDQAGRAFSTREPAELELPRALVPAEVERPVRLTLKGPITIERESRVGDARGLVSLGVIEREGVYELDAPGEESPPHVAVNVCDARATSLSVAPALSIAGTTTSDTAPARERREAWPWLVACAAVLLAIEWLLNAWQTRV